MVFFFKPHFSLALPRHPKPLSLNLGVPGLSPRCKAEEFKLHALFGCRLGVPCRVPARASSKDSFKGSFKVVLVAEFISPQKKVYTFSFIVGNTIPKSVKCVHSATK